MHVSKEKVTNFEFENFWELNAPSERPEVRRGPSGRAKSRHAWEQLNNTYRDHTSHVLAGKKY